MAKIQLTIQHNNRVFSPPIKDNIMVEWERTGSPGKLKFTTVKVKGMDFYEGDAVTLQYDNKKIFMGYVFTKSRSKEQHIEVTCYDQIRYLKNKYTYVFENKRADEIIRAMCKDYNLHIGTFDNTGYKIPAVAEENKAALDISLFVLEETLLNTGNQFTLYDDCGELTIKNSANMVSNTLILSTTAEDFEYKSSIDDETYNNIVLYYKPKVSTSISGGGNSSSATASTPQASKVLQIAAGEVGYKESGTNITKYGQAYGMNGIAWCVIFIWWVFKQAGISHLIKKTASSTALMNWFKDQGRFYSTPQPGDIAFFKWGRGIGAEHVGIVESVSGNSIVSIEGNTSDRVKRLKRDSAILGYGRPAYSKTSASTYSAIDNTSDDTSIITNSSDKIQVFTASDKDKISQWGTLRYFEEIDKPAIGQSKANQLLKLYARKTRDLKITAAFGDPSVRGGTLIPVKLDIGERQISNYMLVEKVTHTFNNDHHTMDLTLGGWWED